MRLRNLMGLLLGLFLSLALPPIHALHSRGTQPTSTIPTQALSAEPLSSRRVLDHGPFFSRLLPASYLSLEGDANLSLVDVGEKAWTLAKIKRAGVPTVDGFVIPVSQVLQVDPLALRRSIRVLERKSGRRVGRPSNPLLLSIRSSADQAYPGLLHSVLFAPMNAEIRAGLEQTRGPQFAWKAYRAFIRGYAVAVADIDASKVDTDESSVLSDEEDARRIESLMHVAGQEVTHDPIEQLLRIISGVVRSGERETVLEFRRAHGQAGQAPVAAFINVMVNTVGSHSGSGYFTSHDPVSGQFGIDGFFVPSTSPDDLMSSSKQHPLAEFAQEFSHLYLDLKNITRRTVDLLNNPLTFEFAFDPIQCLITQVNPQRLTSATAIEFSKGERELQEVLLAPPHRQTRTLLTVKRRRSPSRALLGQLIYPANAEESRSEGKSFIFVMSGNQNTSLIDLLARNALNAVIFVGDAKAGVHSQQLMSYFHVPSVHVDSLPGKNGDWVLIEGEKVLPYHAIEWTDRREDTFNADEFDFAAIRRRVLEVTEGQTYQQILAEHRRFFRQSISPHSPNQSDRPANGQSLLLLTNQDERQRISAGLAAMVLYHRLVDLGSRDGKSEQEVGVDIVREGRDFALLPDVHLKKYRLMTSSYGTISFGNKYVAAFWLKEWAFKKISTLTDIGKEYSRFLDDIRQEAKEALLHVNEFLRFVESRQEKAPHIVQEIETWFDHKHEIAANIFGAYIVGIEFDPHDLPWMLSTLSAFETHRASALKEISA